MDKRFLRPSRRAAIGAVGLLGLALPTMSGCATYVYEPRPSAFIAVRSDGMFVRDGKATTLDGAVVGNPAAETEAARAGAHGGRSLGYLIGGGATMLTAAAAATALGSGPMITTAQYAVGVSSIAGAVIGAGFIIAGAVEQIHEVKHAITAMDVYNDDVTRASCAKAEPTARAPLPLAVAKNAGGR